MHGDVGWHRRPQWILGKIHNLLLQVATNDQAVDQVRNSGHQSQAADINCIILSRKTVNKELREGAEGLNGHSNLVPRIVMEGYLKMCLGMWDGTGGPSGYLERLSTCSEPLLMTR